MFISRPRITPGDFSKGRGGERIHIAEGRMCVRNAEKSRLECEGAIKKSYFIEAVHDFRLWHMGERLFLWAWACNDKRRTAGALRGKRNDGGRGRTLCACLEGTKPCLKPRFMSLGVRGRNDVRCVLSGKRISRRDEVLRAGWKGSVLCG